MSPDPLSASSEDHFGMVIVLWPYFPHEWNFSWGYLSDIPSETETIEVMAAKAREMLIKGAARARQRQVDGPEPVLPDTDGPEFDLAAAAITTYLTRFAAEHLPWANRHAIAIMAGVGCTREQASVVIQAAGTLCAGLGKLGAAATIPPVEVADADLPALP